MSIGICQNYLPKSTRKSASEKGYPTRPNTGKSASSWRTKETTLRQGQEEDASMSQHSVGLSLPEIR